MVGATYEVLWRLSDGGSMSRRPRSSKENYAGWNSWEVSQDPGYYNRVLLGKADELHGARRELEELDTDPREQLRAQEGWALMERDERVWPRGSHDEICLTVWSRRTPARPSKLGLI